MAREAKEVREARADRADRAEERGGGGTTESRRVPLRVAELPEPLVVLGLALEREQLLVPPLVPLRPRSNHFLLCEMEKWVEGDLCGTRGMALSFAT